MMSIEKEKLEKIAKALEKLREIDFESLTELSTIEEPRSCRCECATGAGAGAYIR